MGYRHFEAAVYLTTGEINSIKDFGQFEADFSIFERYTKIGKVYLETYRTSEYTDQDILMQLKAYFQKKGIKIAGGITTTNKSNDQKWGLFCYTKGEDIQKLKLVAQLTATLFDEFIFDDFYFTNCKCESCQAVKGDSKLGRISDPIISRRCPGIYHQAGKRSQSGRQSHHQIPELV